MYKKLNTRAPPASQPIPCYSFESWLTLVLLYELRRKDKNRPVLRINGMLQVKNGNVEDCDKERKLTQC